MFLSEYVLTTGMPGAPVATLNLSVEAPKKKVQGQVRITQAVSPPLDRSTDVHGSFIETADVVVIHLRAEPPAPGGLEFGATIVTKAWGQPGEGWFWYVAGETRYEAGPVPARPGVLAETAHK